MQEGSIKSAKTKTEGLRTKTKSNQNPASSPKLKDPKDPEKSIIGKYGAYAASLLVDPPKLSYRLNKWDDIYLWRKKAISITKELIATPVIVDKPEVIINQKYNYDGLDIEELEWQLPFGHATKALLLKPQGVIGPLPAILALHDHGGNKYFGYRKITQTSDELHPLIKEHQEQYYGGLAWANEMAKRGYVVMVPDVFTFGSRRVRFEDVSESVNRERRTDANPDSIDNVKIYNDWAGPHEHIMSKSLFSAGTTWPGVFLSEDQKALDILAERDDVDKEQIGCCGLSGGGLRSVYLGGLDTRIKCAISVGFMTTWQDFILHKAYTHTWMTYTPLLPKYLQFPEIMGLRVPLPTMVLNNNQDQIFTLSEMKKADSIMKQGFNKAGMADRYLGRFYPGEHVMLFISGGGTFLILMKGKTGISFIDVIADQLHHPPWHGFAFYDLIMPLFLFISGVSISYSLSRGQAAGLPRSTLYKKVFIRMLILIGLGMVYKNAPVQFFDFSEIRFGSVLGRIGIACFATALLFLNYTCKQRLIIIGGILIAYYAILFLIPVPEFGAGNMSKEGNLIGWIDRTFLPGRLLEGNYDELGILTQFSALCITVFGSIAGDILRSDTSENKKSLILLVIGIIAVLIGLIWGMHFPINKKLWSSSFIMLTSGLAFIILSVFYWFIDVQGYRKWTFFFKVIGMNSLAVYFVYRFFNFRKTSEMLFSGLYAPLPEQWHEVFEALGAWALVWLLLYFLFKKGIFIKI